MTVSLVPLEHLRPAPWNPRHIDKARLKNLAESIKADPNFLLRRPILAQTSGEIYAGNQRFFAAAQLFKDGWVPPWNSQTVPADLDDVPDQLARERALRDNNAWGAWDDDSLTRLLGDLRDSGSATDLLGFDDRELSQLLARLGDGRELNPDDADLTPPVDPITKPGDLWILGDHRLLCGDATNPDDVERLMAGERAALMATDPPYVVGYSGGNHPSSYTNQGSPKRNKHWAAYTDGNDALLETYLQVALAAALTERPAIYQWHADLRLAEVDRAWRAAGLLPHQQIIWSKSRAVLTNSHFMWQHESCFYGWIEGKQPTLKPPANATTVWQIDQAGDSDNVHPTQKPVEVFARPIGWHLLPGQLAYEPFAGSGTAVIAAEQAGRRCFAIELAPEFCDVIIRRWERVSGQKAVLQRGR
jgi:DNA modification methylase